MTAKQQANAKKAVRLEHDLIGEREVPTDAYYGIQTLRATENFNITSIKVGDFPNLVRALAMVKKASARANAKLGTNAMIGTVMVDQEGWGSGATPAEVTLNNNEVYNVSGASETRATHSRDGFSPSISAFTDT